MKYISALLFLSCIANVSRADDVLLKNGMIYRNVSVTIDEESVQIDLSYRSAILAKSEIDRIIKKRFDLNKETSFGVATKAEVEEISEDPDALTFPDPSHSAPLKRQPKKIITYPNSGFIAVAILGGVGAWICFSQSSDKSKASGTLHDAFGNSVDTSDLDSKSTTYTILGVGCALTGLGSLIYAMTPVEVAASPNGVQLSYRF